MSQIDKRLAFVACVVAASMSFIGCAHRDERVDTTAQTVPAGDSGEMHQHATGVVDFERGQFLLTDATRDTLRKLVQNLNADNVDEVKVAVWSDNPFPMQDESLSAADRELADRRGDAIENFLEDELKISDVQIFNMAKRSNWMARLFNTDDAELKSSMGYQNRGPINDADIQFLKQNGGPSKAAVIVERDME
jgi:type IV pilus biogenesis protein CpaD/CtpE